MLARRRLDVPAAWIAAAVQTAVGSSTGSRALVHDAVGALEHGGVTEWAGRVASSSGASSSQGAGPSSGWQCSCSALPSCWSSHSSNSMALELTCAMSTSTRHARGSSRRPGGSRSSRDDSPDNSTSSSGRSRVQEQELGGGRRAGTAPAGQAGTFPSSRAGKEQRKVLGGTVVPFKIQRRAPVPASSSDSRSWGMDQQGQSVQAVDAAVQFAGQEARPGAVTSNELMGRIQSTQSLLDLEEVLADGSRSFTYKHLGAVASRVPPLVRASAGDLAAPRQLARLMAALEHLYDRAMHMLPARTMAHLLWSATKVQHRLSERTLLSCTQQLVRDGAVRLREANGADLSLIAWGLAWQRMEAPAVWDAITEAAIARMEHLAPQSLSTLASAFADADRFDQPLMEALAARSLALLPQFQAMQMVHLAWAFSKLSYPDAELFAGIQTAITPRLADINSRALGMLLSAFSHSHHPGAKTLLNDAEPHVLPALASMTPFSLNNVAAAYAGLGCGSEELWGALCQAAVGRLHSYQWPQLEMLLRVLRHRTTQHLQDAVAAALQAALSQSEAATTGTHEDASAMRQVAGRLAALGHAQAAALQAAADGVMGQEGQAGAHSMPEQGSPRAAAMAG